jgi:hypothetical protein
VQSTELEQVDVMVQVLVTVVSSWYESFVLAQSPFDMAV